MSPSRSLLGSKRGQAPSEELGRGPDLVSGRRPFAISTVPRTTKRTAITASLCWFPQFSRSTVSAWEYAGEKQHSSTSGSCSPDHNL